MKVFFTDQPHPVILERFEAAGIQSTVDTQCTYDELLVQMPDYDGLVVRSRISIDAGFIDKMGSRCRVIGREGAGMETIDVAYAESKGVRCINSPEGNRDAVGEHATGLLLALFDKIALANDEVRQGLWNREANRGLEVKGKTVGIIGFGNMGAAFAQRLMGFECNIIAYDKYLPEHTKANFQRLNYVRQGSLQELQSQADIVSLHIPLTEESHYLVDESFLASFQNPIYLINTARGKVVKTAALVEAMEKGQVLGAALDVIEYENMAKDGLRKEELPEPFRYLIQSNRTVLTPHVGGWTVESKFKLAAFLADKIIVELNK